MVLIVYLPITIFKIIIFITNLLLGDMKKKASTLHPITIGKRSSTRGSLYTRTRSGVAGLRRLQRKAQLPKGL